jgi:hypothetical protein
MLDDVLRVAGLAFIFAGVPFAAFAPGNVQARAVARVTTLFAAVCLGLGWLATAHSASLEAALESTARTHWLLSFAIASAGVFVTNLMGTGDARPGEIACVCLTLGCAATLPFAVSPWLVGVCTSLGMAGPAFTASRRRDGPEAGAMILLLACLPGVLLLSGVLPGMSAGWSMALWLFPIAAVAPLHFWYLRLAEALPATFLATTLLLQVAAVRCAIEMLPLTLQHDLAGWMAASAAFMALLALGQTSARRAAASLLSSQLSIAAYAGLEIHEGPESAGVFLLLTLASATTGWVMLLGALESRIGHSLKINRPGGCYESWPHLATTFMVLGLASAGLPLSLGFVASDLVLRVIFATQPLHAGAIILAMALNAICLVRMFLFFFQGAPGSAQPSDLRAREILVTALTVMASFGLALFALPG